MVRAAGPRRHWAVLAAYLAAAVVVLVGAAAAGFAFADSRRPPPPPPPSANIVVVPPAEASAHQDGRPQIAPYQSLGDGNTVFVLHGQGWAPGQPVTVALAGRASPDHPIVDLAGTFSYAINQAHEFFSGPLPPGTYRVMVTTPDGAKAVASFVVRRPPPGPTSTTGPPGASTTPGH
jgi:hypothetical protein